MLVETPIYIKVCCAHYRNFYIYACHWIILYYTTLLISRMFLWVLTSLCPLHVCDISLTIFKEFRIFWPSSFVDPSVKGTDNFWKIRGLIEGFNRSRRQIASGVEKTADYSMSAIQFCTTPKGCLPHYSYIFRAPEPLGTEIKNVAWSRLGTMLHLDIQKGEEAMYLWLDH